LRLASKWRATTGAIDTVDRAGVDTWVETVPCANETAAAAAAARIEKRMMA